MKIKNLILVMVIIFTTYSLALAQKIKIDDVIKKYDHVFEWKIKPKYYSLINSEQNILAAAMKQYRHGYIDINENIIVPLKWGYISGVDEHGFGVVGKSYENWKYFLDLKKGGAKAFDKKFQHATVFIDGYAIVGTPGTPRYGVVDTLGNFIIPYKFGAIRRTSNFADILEGKSDDYIPAKKFKQSGFGPGGYINRKGEWIKEPWVYVPYPRRGDFYVVESAQGGKGLLDLELNEVTPMKYSMIVGFNQPYIHVKKAGKYGLLNKVGKEALALEFDRITFFKDGKAYFENGDDYGYIHADGLKVESVGKLNRKPLAIEIPLETEEKGDFILFSLDKKQYGLGKLINGKFEELLPTKYSNIKLTHINGKTYFKLFYKESRKTYFGLCTLDMEMIIDPEKKEFTMIDVTNSSGYAAIGIGGKIGLAKFKL